MNERRIFQVGLLVVVALVLAAPSAVAAPSGQTACTVRATYVADVTVPDNTIMAPGTSFVKTWRIRNDGTCPWGPGHAVDTLEMIGGSAMGTPTRVPLNETVRAGQTGDISIKMQAPALVGTYRNEWKFRRTDGQLFGLGATRATPFYAQVIVRTDSTNPPPGGERIQFPSGATVSSVQGRVSNNVRKSYLLRARAGQPMRIALVSANPAANFSVVGVTDGQPYKRIEVGDPWFSFVLPSTQDYRIDVGVASGAGTASYVLAIAIAP